MEVINSADIIVILESVGVSGAEAVSGGVPEVDRHPTATASAPDTPTDLSNAVLQVLLITSTGASPAMLQVLLNHQTRQLVTLWSCPPG